MIATKHRDSTMFQEISASDIEPIVNSIIKGIMSERSLRSKQRAETETIEYKSRTKISLKSKKKKKKPRSVEFYKSIVSKFNRRRKRNFIGEDFNHLEHEETSYGMMKHKDFQAAFGPNEMRCLAIASHNEMKVTLKNFLECHKHILKKFRLTGTASTMKIIHEVFDNEPDVVFGPTYSSGLFGGDGELVSLMATGKLGGVLIFQDPMTSNHHQQADIECLTRQAMVHNSVIATTPTTITAIMQVLQIALEGKGMAGLIPSFFFPLRSPSIATHKTARTMMMDSSSTCDFSKSMSLREACKIIPTKMVESSVSDLSVTSILVDSRQDRSDKSISSLSLRDAKTVESRVSDLSVTSILVDSRKDRSDKSIPSLSLRDAKTVESRFVSDLSMTRTVVDSRKDRSDKSIRSLSLRDSKTVESRFVSNRSMMRTLVDSRKDRSDRSISSLTPSDACLSSCEFAKNSWIAMISDPRRRY